MGALGWLSIRLRILHTWAFKVFIVIYSYSHVIRLSLMHTHYIFSRPSWPPMYFSHILFVYIHIHVVHTHTYIHLSLHIVTHTPTHYFRLVHGVVPFGAFQDKYWAHFCHMTHIAALTLAIHRSHMLLISYITLTQMHAYTHIHTIITHTFMHIPRYFHYLLHAWSISLWAFGCPFCYFFVFCKFLGSNFLLGGHSCQCLVSVGWIVSIGCYFNPILHLGYIFPIFCPPPFCSLLIFVFLQVFWVFSLFRGNIYLIASGWKGCDFVFTYSSQFGLIIAFFLHFFDFLANFH